MSDESRDIQRLIADAVEDSRDGALDAKQLEEIQQLLLTSAEARRAYLEHNRFSQMLTGEVLRRRVPDNALAGIGGNDGILAVVSEGVRPIVAYAGWVTAVIVFVATGIWSAVLLSGPDTEITGTGRPMNDLPDDDIVAAVITQQIDADWGEDGNAFETGQTLEDEWLRLTSGIVQVEFSSGAQLALQGPAALRIDSDRECFLQSGKLTVLAPPEASRFTVKSPAGNVIDLGTEFGVVVDESGHLDVHVLDGEVELELVGSDRKSIESRRLVENEGAAITPNGNRIEDSAIDRSEFETIRHDTLIARRPLKFQFDCGVRAGVYQGAQSPGHAAGDFADHEVYWNPVIGDQSGLVALADGSTFSTPIEVDYGRSERKGKINWDAEPDLTRATMCKSRGVFATALGEDNINGMGGTLALRFRGLPPGKYRVYLMGRSTTDHDKWGNYLVLKAFKTSIGVNLHELPASTSPISPLDDPNASDWVQGETHRIGEVQLDGPDDYLTVMSRKDRHASPKPAGGRSSIVGLQIIQVID